LNHDKEKLTFVLTLALSGTGRDDDDLRRVDLMFRSLAKFLEKQCLEEFIIVTRSADMEAVRSAVQTGLNQQKLRILDENTICPEFLDDPETPSQWPKPNKGWYRQQLIKLAIHEHVQTEFYMTVDSDVIFTKPFSPDSLFKDGRGLLNTQYANDFKQLYREDIAAKEVKIRRARYKDAGMVLKCSRPDQYLDRWYGETPVLLSSKIVHGLTRHIENTWDQPWRQVLLQMLPWTEYALYFQYAEFAGLLEKYHYAGDMNSVLNLENSLWRPADDYRYPCQLADWDTSKAFDSKTGGVAIVVQSYLGYPVDEVADKVLPYIDQEAP
jgi:hypothetical protein